MPRRRLYKAGDALGDSVLILRGGDVIKCDVAVG